LLAFNITVKGKLFVNFVYQLELTMQTKTIEEYSIHDYDLIIFDCDGTLVDSEHLSNTLLAEMLRELGMECDDEEIIRMFAGTSFEKITSYLKETLTSGPPFDFEREFRKRSKVIFENELLPIEGVKQFIEALDCKKCVASNGPREKMQITLSATGLKSYFPDDCIFSAYDIQKWKPEPELYLSTAATMDISTDKSLVIEDTYHGAMGAVNANIDVLVYSPKNTDSQILQKGIPTFASFRQLANSIL